jgi:predicted membrane-bound spermidine synthase
MSTQNAHGTSPTPAPAAVQPIPDQATDPFFYRVLIIGLVAAVLVTIGGTIALAALERPVPEGLIAIGSAAVGGLVGLLIPSPTR